jgi:hypothetical protein
MKISFCSTCCNRLWQLKETLTPNLEVLDSCELVDYGSTDGLSDWIWQNFQSAVDQGRLVFFETTNAVRWNSARAKNLAHRLGSGDYLFNLDADNFITQQDLEKIKDAALTGKPCQQFSGNWEDGSYGRIGLPTSVFRELGGYDETLLAMAVQDRDLVNRLEVYLGAPVHPLQSPGKLAVSNSKEDKTRLIPRFLPTSQGADADTVYRALQRLNELISAIRMETEGPVRLGGGFTYKGMLNGKRVTVSGLDDIFTDPLKPESLDR